MNEKRRESYTQISASFEREEAGAEKINLWIKELPEGSPERDRLCEIQQHYGNLLKDARLLVRMGDRLQAKLRAANEELARKNEEIAEYNRQLSQKNRELQETLNALQESQRRRKALTVLGISAIVVFMITELIEYYIERTASGTTSQWANFISFGLKALIALAFKPLEELVESILSRTVR
ncbi:MAG: hypothetical protein NZZ60_04760 [Bacteroidia bacterium]|nr:hypothetical protein [Bacteroidia bacterium]MCX7652778.1 hypothetical protein [Bacteroidia bacterium]MDW8417389.1 hypothetical protein [Bacteroidia bacterium]